jgi:hypothetical protein
MPYETIPGADDPGMPGPLGSDIPIATPGVTGGDTVEVPIGDATISGQSTQAVYARDLTMNQSASMTADVVGDLAAVDSAIAMANVQGAARIVESPMAAMVTSGPVDLEGGWTGLVVAPEFTVRDGGSVLMTQREAIIFAAVFAGVLLLGSLLLRLVFGSR